MSSSTSSLLLTVLAIAVALSPVARAQKGRNAMMDVNPQPLKEECRTLPNFRQLFIESCLTVIKEGNVNSTCQMAWEKFSGGFAGKDPLTVELSDYEDYFDLLKVESQRNSVIFWSGVQSLIEAVSNTTEYTISSSFTQPASNIINNMAEYPVCWCGNATGIDYVNPCPDKPSTSFWAELSCLLGESASGISFFLGNGEREGGTYRKQSFFAEYEFTKLTPPKDTELVVLDVHRMGYGEACGSGSLVQLQNEAIEKFGKDGYTCYDICGDVSDEEEIPELADEVLKIIGAEQGNGAYMILHQLHILAIYVIIIIIIYTFLMGHTELLLIILSQGFFCHNQGPYIVL